MPEPFQHFPPGELERLKQFALSEKLAGQRVALMFNLPQQIVDSAADGRSHANQLSADLQNLNRIEEVPNGTIPLMIWLNNARSLIVGVNSLAILDAFLNRFALNPPIENEALGSRNSEALPYSVNHLEVRERFCEELTDRGPQYGLVFSGSEIDNCSVNYVSHAIVGFEAKRVNEESTKNEIIYKFSTETNDYKDISLRGVHSDLRAAQSGGRLHKKILRDLIIHAKQNPGNHSAQASSSSFAGIPKSERLLADAIDHYKNRDKSTFVVGWVYCRRLGQKASSVMENWLSFWEAFDFAATVSVVGERPIHTIVPVLVVLNEDSQPSPEVAKVLDRDDLKIFKLDCRIEFDHLDDWVEDNRDDLFEHLRAPRREKLIEQLEGLLTPGRDPITMLEWTDMGDDLSKIYNSYL